MMHLLVWFAYYYLLSFTFCILVSNAVEATDNNKQSRARKVLINCFFISYVDFIQAESADIEFYPMASSSEQNY